MLLAKNQTVSPDILNIGLDLGGDTLKISFAYADGSEIKYGKFTGYGKITNVALPALAYYDTDARKWYYADAIEKQSSEAFVTVVKIKNLLSLLTMPEIPRISFKSLSPAQKAALRAEREKNNRIWSNNRRYYFEGHSFPKFYFPVRRALLADFDRMVNSDMTFEVADTTPKAVCVNFFKYVYALINSRKSELESSIGRTFSDMRVSIVHPANVGDDYLTELSSIINLTFGKPPFKVLSSNKALALYAKQKGIVKTSDTFLVFDMGEESISVAQAAFMNGRVVIDGVEGHTPPLSIGGNDVDEAIVNYLEYVISGRETFGTPSAGAPGHISEGSVYSKQYQLMKDVKRAKIIFSKSDKGDVFEGGVPVTFNREVLVQRNLTEADLQKCLGITDNNGISRKIADYIIGELKLPINRKVGEVFISGGVTETFSLISYLKKALELVGCHIPICTFDDGIDEPKSSFDILSFEDSVFAPSVGGAIVSLLNIEIPTILSLSYGSWLIENNLRILNIFANRGDIIGSNGARFWTRDAFYIKDFGVDDEEIFSTTWTQADIAEYSRKQYTKLPFTYDSTGRRKNLIIGTPYSRERKMAENAVEGIGLNLVSGGEDGKIFLIHNGDLVILPDGAYILAREGIELDKNGRARPIIANTTGPDKAGNIVTVKVYRDPNNRRSIVGYKTVRLGEIQPVFNGVDEFGTSIS